MTELRPNQWWLVTKKNDPSTAEIVWIGWSGDIYETGFEAEYKPDRYNFIRKLDLEELANGKS